MITQTASINQVGAEFPAYNMYSSDGGKMIQKAASSPLVSRFLYHFSHRMDIRCFLTGSFGQDDEPSGPLPIQPIGFTCGGRPDACSPYVFVRSAQ